MLILTSKPRSVFREGKNVKGTQAYIFNNNIVKTDVGNKHLVLYLDIKQNNEKINIKVYSVPCQTSETEFVLKVVQSWKPLTIFMKISMFDDGFDRGFEVFEMRFWNM